VTATTLTIRGAAGGASPAESAVLGRGNTIGTLDARVANGLRLDNGGNDLAVAQAVGGTVTLATSGALTLQGAVGQSGATVQLNVSGALAQAGGAVMAGSLVVRDATGDGGHSGGKHRARPDQRHPRNRCAGDRRAEPRQ
jgi:hypothetical protein